MTAAVVWIAAAVWVAAALPLALGGLGARIRPLLGDTPCPAPAAGLAAFLWAGGIANALHVAFTPVVAVLLVSGVAAAAFQLRGRPAAPVPDRRLHLLLLAFMVAATAFLASSQLCPSAYNRDDDLQKYLSHPVRMLETGTLLGSPLSSLGTESLGGMAWAQGAVLCLFPVRYANAADGVLGPVLLFACILSALRARPSVGWAGAVAALAVVVVDPYYANTSALYLGSVLVFGACLAADAGEAGPDRTPRTLGLLYAGLVALKPTFILFAGAHAALLFAWRALGKGQGPAAMAGLMRTVGWAGFFLAPWIAVHAPHYLEGLRTLAAGDAPAAAAWVRAHRPVHWFEGDTYHTGYPGLGSYTILVLCLAALGAVAAARRPRSARAAAAACAAAVLIYPLLIVGVPRLLHYADADPKIVRYFAPVAIGVLPAAVCLAADLSARARRLACLVGLLALPAFVPSALDRWSHALRYGTYIRYFEAFPGWCAVEMGPDNAAALRRVQQAVPAGEPVLVCVGNTYLLSFARNPVVDVDPAGLTAPWARMPRLRWVLLETRPGVGPRAKIADWIDNLSLTPQDAPKLSRVRELDQRLASILAPARLAAASGRYVLYQLADAAAPQER